MIYWDLRSAAEEPALLEGEAPDGLLSSPERVFFARLRIPKRRREWLLGRWAAKSLCRAWLRRQGREVSMEKITIAARADGSPFVLVAGEGELAVTLSLSHCDGHALCVLCRGPNAPLGADLERCEPRPSGFAQDFFTSDEVASLVALPEAERCRATTEMWSLKEAALKALRLGLSVDTRRVETRARATTGQGWSLVPVGLSGMGADTAAAFVRGEGPYVISVAWAGGELANAPSDELRGGYRPSGPWYSEGKLS